MSEKITLIGGTRRRSRVEVFALGPNNTILVSSKGMGNYPELPGGGVDEDESDESAGIRELEEEAGWLAVDPYVLNVMGDWVYRGKDDPWYNKDGWDEEENIAVICKAVRFAPDESYGSENDHHYFKLIPIDDLYKETEVSINSDCSKRRVLAARFRMMVLIALKNKVAIESIGI